MSGARRGKLGFHLVVFHNGVRHEYKPRGIYNIMQN